MEDKIVDIIISRLDKLEGKIDMLLAKDWKRAGAIMTVVIIFSIMFQVGLALIEHK